MAGEGRGGGGPAGAQPYIAVGLNPKILNLKPLSHQKGFYKGSLKGSIGGRKGFRVC